MMAATMVATGAITGAATGAVTGAITGAVTGAVTLRRRKSYTKIMKLYDFGLVLLLLAAPAGAQFPPPAADVSAPPQELEATELFVDPLDLEQVWLEVTPLAGDATARLWRLGDLKEDDEGMTLDPKLPPGPALLCTGARRLGVRCEEIYLDRAPPVDFVGPEIVWANFSFGVSVQGTFLLGAEALEGVRVGVVPAGLVVDGPFTMPLGFRDGELLREIESDEEGRFELPPLAMGTYFIEAVLPSGRVYRGDPFELTSLEALELSRAPEAGERVVWDLGILDVADGLILEVRVLDLEDQPLPDVRVSARQGNSATDVQTYELYTDGEGVARLGGLGVESPLWIALEAPGYRSLRQEHALAPALLTVLLEPLASMTGEVLGFDGLGPPEAVIAVENLSVAPAPVTFPPATQTLPERLPTANAPRMLQLGSAGQFSVNDLVAGRYRMTVTAPGYEVRRREVELTPGERLDLGPMLLAAGRAVEGRVVDAETEEGISGAEIRIVEPPGAALAESDAKGEFEFATASDQSVTLRVEAEGYASVSLKLTPARLRAEEPLEIALERAGWILTQVFADASGTPCQGCPLVIQPGNIELRTNAQGEALSPSLAPGAYRVTRPAVNHLGSMVIEEPEAALRHARVKRDKITVVRFEAKERSLVVRFDPRVAPRTRLRARGTGGEQIVLPAADGQFTLEARPGERLELFLHLYDPATDRETQIYQDTLVGPADGLVKEHVLPRRSTEVHGVVRVDQKPAAGVRVRLRTLNGITWAESSTHPDGRFRVPHLPPGAYVVMIGERSVHFISLADRQRLDLGTFDVISGSY